MDLQAFFRRRSDQWNRLDRLIDKIDRQGMESLSREEVNEFFGLYRLTSSDLNLVTTRTGNPSLIDYLQSLVARAYVHLTPPRRVRIISGWWSIIRHRFPEMVRREAVLLAISTGLFVGATIFAFIVTLVTPSVAEAFLPIEHLTESPSERVARLEAMERSGKSQVNTGSEHAAFTTFLFTHNIRVCCLAFSLGFTLGIGTAVVLVINGAMLGSLAALYFDDGQMRFFTAWIGPHGSIELPCIFLSGMGGLMIARMQYRRDRGTLIKQLQRSRSDLVSLIVGFSTLLVLAGLVEGGFSQVNEPTLSYTFKQAIACLLFAGLLGYLFLLPIRKRPATEVAEL